MKGANITKISQFLFILLALVGLRTILSSFLDGMSNAYLVDIIKYTFGLLSISFFIYQTQKHD